MSEEEINNKIRLNEVRRQTDRAGIENANLNNNVPMRQRNQNKPSSKEKTASNLIKNIATPLAAMNKARDIATAPSEFGVMDIPIYGMALALAGFKDLLDLAIGIIPGVVTVIGWCISMVIGFILLFDGVGGAQRKVARNLTKKMLVLLAGTIVESLFFGLNYIPFEMFTVVIIYWMSLLERKRAQRIEEGN